ncbi:DNA polymerase III subunit gamma/tau [Clostridium cellulovorans]|uniref:DNA-directed DNA polymerase n=1 Tax=Clostridium cellulovorans (strain ATCC 35296 / DSM 3052 / OCM 3 / 743B) TaxID=573061 RepID=D9SMQ4_CLOC7|nr:DNA polymerase III subunit gamma/tau [Clostridium cellulovorans]ADL49839.1 DNA polymerase III, subunits gamma and tau [Clostridium cellulovorans 743B]
MAYKALYREWRPRNFGEVVGQSQVTVTLKNQVKNNRIAHAYLLCGTRGTGKTSTAKILSKAVNCLNPIDGEPCNECEMCKKINEGIAIDVTEMDAASHNGVDDIRNIIEDVQYPPQEAKFKVYIIDEVHMLTMGAVNAFLKTLEEPPKRVLFILATTDPQKLPITILSRCQRYDFKRIRNVDIQARLRSIVDNKNIEADDLALSFIARICDGALRDAVSILDQSIAMGNGVVNYDDVINILGIVTNEHLLRLTECIIEKDIGKAIHVVDDVIYSGKDVNLFVKELVTHMRNLLMVKVTENPEEVLDMSMENIAHVKEQSSKIRVEEIMRHINILQESEEQMKWSKQSRIYLELAIIKMCKIEYDTSKEMLLSRINKIEEMIQSGDISLEIKPKEEQQKPIIKPRAASVPKVQEISHTDEENSALSSDISLEYVKKHWQDILETLKQKRLMSIYAYLKPGEPVECVNGVLKVKFGEKYGFSKVNLEKSENGKKVEEIFYQVLKGKIRIVYIVEQNDNRYSESPEKILRDSLGVDIEVIDE